MMNCRYELAVTSSHHAMTSSHLSTLWRTLASRWTTSWQCSGTSTKSPRSACFHHIRRLEGPEVTATLTSAFLLSKLDYCNWPVCPNLPLHHCSIYTTYSERSGQTHRISHPRDHITRTLEQLHWLPVQYRFTYKLSTNAFDSLVTSTVLSHWRCYTNSQCHTMNTTSVRHQSPLWTTTHTTKVRTTSVFIRCTGRVEQSATVASTSILDCIF